VVGAVIGVGWPGAVDFIGFPEGVVGKIVVDSNALMVAWAHVPVD
jgi:hypothetical protein